MKKITWLILFACFGCEEPWDYYEVYSIPEGKHESTYKIQLLQSSSLKFKAKFDHSAEYISHTVEDQLDTHKLLGFSDCNSHHHENSARFGWRWVDGNIEIMVYCYANGVRFIEKIGESSLNEENDYLIEVNEYAYIFTYNKVSIEVTRGDTCEKGFYYMLYPYFGGNEVAPHQIDIMIRRFY